MTEATQSRPAPAPIAPCATLTFLEEDQADARSLRWGLGIALVFHATLLAIHFPEMVRTTRSIDQKQKVFVMRALPYKKQVLPIRQEIPEPRATKVPIPDPTPDEPEPILLAETDAPEIDPLESSEVWGIPTGPPPIPVPGPMAVLGDVVPPEKLDAPPPIYPEIARKAGVEGVVLLQAIIDKQGNVTNVKILRSRPMGLDQAAVTAVKRWRFQPASLDGRPVTVFYNLTVNFAIQR